MIALLAYAAARLFGWLLSFAPANDATWTEEP